MTDRADKADKAAKAMLERMRAKHPAAFPIPIRPLKIGIREDLIAAGWTADEVSQALSYYVNIKPYMYATDEMGAFRIDLNGCPTTPVQDHEAAWARRVIAGQSPTLLEIMKEYTRGGVQC